jgi:hypothetical protein
MKLIVSILFIVFSFANISRAEFTVSADVTNGTVFQVNISRATEYFKDISVFQRNFPGIISVKKLGDKESEWVYEIDAPLASPVRMPFILLETISADDYMVFESKSKTPDFFRCSARMISLGEEETRISITIKIKMVRESGSDVHFMAPILGEKFISKEMKKDLSKALSTFLSKCRKEI